MCEKVQDSLVSSFTDDTTISCHITNVEVFHLQDLDRMYAWAAANNMSFIEEKFEMLRCGPSQQIKELTTLHTEGGHDITPSPHMKCLSDDGSFSHHITEVKKAKGMAGWVLRTFASREPEILLTLWKSLVQPTLDYCS